MDRMLGLAVHPDDPRRSSVTCKIYHTWIPCIVGFFVCFASTSTVPAGLQLQQAFGIGEKAALLPFALFILGLGLGPIIGAPISENFGRRPVYWLSVPVFCLFTVGAALSPSFASMLVCRFFAGAFGGSALVVGFGLLTDVWGSHRLPIALSIFNTVPFMGPSVGQLVNAFVVETLDWRWTQWVTLLLGALTWLTVLPMSETYLPVITKRATDRLQDRQSKVSAREVTMRVLSSIPFLRPLQMLVTEPVVGLFAVYVSFNFAIVYCFSSSVPFAFQTVYDFSPTAQGLVFLGLTVGYILAAPTMVVPFYFQMRKHTPRAKSPTSEDDASVTESPEPEALLWPALLGSVAMPISFFWFAWSANADTHWMCPIVGLGLFAWGNDLLYNAAQLYLLETYGSKYGASATAANNLLRYCLAAILPLFMTEMYGNLGVKWAATLLGFILLLFLPIPWAFRRYGPWLRSHSRYVVHKEGGGFQSDSN
ncbi:putative MFS transporter [Chaetomium fimeti]|uniref:MFS transporter n=1 Tax=Chaetomium fimeti TaxID=1854472 RepID=A0AAE0LQI2_9PEZI|nr:putative MFS transporter [Chaetomium fimeti]